jgi:hypothetical protein
MALYDNPHDFVNSSAFCKEVKEMLISLYDCTEEQAILLIYEYREAFTKLQPKTEPREVALRIGNDKTGLGAKNYIEYLDTMNKTFQLLGESMKMPSLINKPSEICLGFK